MEFLSKIDSSASRLVFYIIYLHNCIYRQKGKGPPRKVAARMDFRYLVVAILLQKRIGRLKVDLAATGEFRKNLLCDLVVRVEHPDGITRIVGCVTTVKPVPQNAFYTPTGAIAVVGSDNELHVFLSEPFLGGHKGLDERGVQLADVVLAKRIDPSDA